MKKFCAIVLLLGLMASLVGCKSLSSILPYEQVDEIYSNFRPEEETQALAVMDPGYTEENQPVEETPGEDTWRVEQPSVLFDPSLLVGDAFMDTWSYEDYQGNTVTKCYHIPRFNMGTSTAEWYNAEIYAELYEILENDYYSCEDMPFAENMLYTWTLKDDIVSLLVSSTDMYGGTQFFTYHMCADGSATIADAVIWSHYGFDEDSFYALAAQKMDQKYRSFYGGAGLAEEDFYWMQLEKTLAYDNVRKARPFIAENGDLCCVATIFSLAGADSYDQMINLTGTTDPDWLSCDIHG